MEYSEHPSISESLDDFATPMSEPSSPFNFGQIPSTHSGFRSRSVDEESEPESTTDSAGPWSPPAWNRPASGWLRGAGSTTTSPSRSRQASPQHDDSISGAEEIGECDVTLIPAKIPLPGSPEKQSSPSRSPSPELKKETPPPTVQASSHARETHSREKSARTTTDRATASVSPAPDNYIRFAMRAEVMQRTDSFEAAVLYMRQITRRITASKTSIVAFVALLLGCITIFQHLTQPPETIPGPDLVKVAGLAKSFEPLIHYSEHGVQQIGDLQETGVAVWDLGESVRQSNMTSAPIITKELDALSESLKTLAIELTKFFANVDGDVDSILIVMEWAKRELTHVTGPTPTIFQSTLANIHQIATRVAGPQVADLFGQTHAQLTLSTLHRTFNEFLNVLEESINSELQYSTTLFSLFEGIDRQFLNLQRTVIRETDTQDAEKERKDAEFLPNLWRRLTSANTSRLAKYEKNRALLFGIRDRTVQNKLVLAEHNGKLLQLKSNLEILRKRLISPLVRGNASSTLSVIEQIQGLDGTYEYLLAAREKQKRKALERLWAGGKKTSYPTLGDDKMKSEI